MNTIQVVHIENKMINYFVHFYGDKAMPFKHSNACVCAGNFCHIFSAYPSGCYSVTFVLDVKHLDLPPMETSAQFSLYKLEVSGSLFVE